MEERLGLGLTDRTICFLGPIKLGISDPILAGLESVHHGFVLETGPYNTHSRLVLCLDKIFVDNFVDKVLGFLDDIFWFGYLVLL